MLDPARRDILLFQTAGRLSRLGITELRFESAEPSPAEVLALFPPGEYRFRGRTVDGAALASVATLTHDFPPAPTFSPSGGEVVDHRNTVVEWSAPGAEMVASQWTEGAGGGWSWILSDLKSFLETGETLSS